MDVFGSNPFLVGLNNNIKINKNKSLISQKALKTDSFRSMLHAKYCDEVAIMNMISENSEVIRILKENNLPVRLNMKELNDLMQNHALETAEIAVSIVKSLPPALKQQVNIYSLKEGAMLHDFGKVLIPPEILNKPALLSKSEFKIMDLHSELGYQLLKKSGLNDEILKLIRYHHKPNAVDFDINLQVLNLADKYSALTEKRVYKDAFSHKSGLIMLYKEVKNGQIYPAVYNALVLAEAAKELSTRFATGM